MRINHVTDKFVKLEKRSGCNMRSVWDSENRTQTLMYSHSRDPIAEIYDYRDSKNFRLRLHPLQQRYGKISHNNRLNALLRSVQMPSGSSGWENFRYSTFVHYSVRVYDRRLNAEYVLNERPMEFQLRDGVLTIDYQALETSVFPDATPVTPHVEIDNSNLRSVSTRLTTILQGV